MKYKIALDATAQNDLAEIYDYLSSRAGDEIAERYVSDIVDYCESFADFPARGTRHNSGLRTVGFRRRATIAFRIKDDIVTIFRIFHRGRNIDLFRDLPIAADDDDSAD